MFTETKASLKAHTGSVITVDTHAKDAQRNAPTQPRVCLQNQALPPSQAATLNSRTPSYHLACKGLAQPSPQPQPGSRFPLCVPIPFLPAFSCYGPCVLLVGPSQCTTPNYPQAPCPTPSPGPAGRVRNRTLRLSMGSHLLAAPRLPQHVLHPAHHPQSP